MPYIKRGFPQAIDHLDAGVKDVYSSPSVFINNVPVALWKEAVTGNSALSALSMPAAAPVDDYAPNQGQRDNYSSNQNLAALDPQYTDSIAGGNTNQNIATTGGDAPAFGTGDPNDPIGNPQNLGSPITLAPGDTVWGRLENLLNQCLQEAAGGAWAEKTPPGSIAPNYVANDNIMQAFAQVGYPKNVLDNTFPGPGTGKPGDQVYWCAAFAGFVLKAAGSSYLNSLSSASYTQAWDCQRVNVADQSAWRRNDLVWFDWGHVSFIREIKNGRAYCTGGNQGNNVTTSGFPLARIAFVGRNWTVPDQYNVPMI
jgi:hypothetical protein